MSLKRVLRTLVCFLLICSILVTCIKPITVDALAIETAVALGIVAFFILASAGVVYTVHTQQDFVALGTSMQNHMHSWASANDVAEIWDSQVEMWNNAFDDWDDEYGKGPMLIVKAGILLGLAIWVKNIIMGDEEVEVEGEAAPEGYAYYNGYLFPTLISKDGYPYEFIFYHSTESCYYSVVSEGLVGSYGSGSSNYGPGSSSYVYVLESETWKYSATYPGKYSRYSFNLHPIVWSNHDVCNVYDSEEVYFIGSEPVYVGGTETVTPSAYVGDIPEQVQSGEMEPEQIPLLSSLALGGLISSSANAVSDVSAVSEGLATGTLTYDAFLEQITPEADSETDPDPGGDSEVNSDLSNYAVDLTSFFPFCIPFDIYKFLTLLMAEPEAPRFEFKFNLGEYLGTHYLVIDLSQWNDTALLLRRLELLLFIIGLAMATRNYYIRG